MSVYRFPNDSDELKKWIQAIPNANLTVTKNTVICELHWPENFETVKVRGGKLRPKNPPSVWSGIPLSQIPSTSAPERTTKRAFSAVRNIQADELTVFLATDKISYSTLKKELLERKKQFQYPIISYLADDIVHIQSIKLHHGIPLFVIKIFQNLHFEAFHLGIRCSISTLSKNRVSTIDSWSIFDEHLRYLSSSNIDNKTEVILQHISSMKPKVVGHKIYTPEIIVRAFVYFAASRALYQRLRIDYQLPSVRTLTRITSKISQVDKKNFWD